MSNRKPILIIKGDISSSDVAKFSELCNDSELSKDYHILVLQASCTCEIISIGVNEKVTVKETKKTFYKRMLSYVIRPNK